MGQSSEYKVNIVISTKDQSSGGLKKAGTNWTDLKSKVDLATMAFKKVYDAGKKAYAFMEMGAGVEAATNRFTQFAGGAEQARIYLDALSRASDGTLDRMGAMTSGAKLLQMGLVTDAEGMETVASMAVKLGDQTKGATDRMSDFALMLANQSILRLDNFGISSGKVKARIEELQAATKGMTREAAFQQATLEEGAKALATLGDTSDLTKTKTDLLAASFKTTKQNMAEMVAQSELVRYALDDVGGWWEMVAVLTDKSRRGTEAYTESLDAWKERYGVLADAGLKLYGIETKHEQALRDNYRNTWSLAQVTDDLGNATDDTAEEIKLASGALWDYGDSTDDAESGMEALTGSSENVRRALYRQKIEAQETAKVMREELATLSLDMAVGFAGYADAVMEQEERLASDRDTLHADHMASLADIERRGQSYMVQVDAEAEQIKLAQLKENLAIAMQAQSEFTEKTKESTRMRKEREIRTLTEGIAEQEALLADFYDGGIVAKGENVDALIAEENRQYAEKQRLIAEEEAALQAQRDRDFQQMMVSDFENWAKVMGIGPTEAQNMKQEMMLEFGLITQDQKNAADAMVETWGNWATETWADWDYVALKMKEVKGLLEGMPMPGSARSYVPSQYWESVPGMGGSTTTNNSTVVAPVLMDSTMTDTSGQPDYERIAEQLVR